MSLEKPISAEEQKECQSVEQLVEHPRVGEFVGEIGTRLSDSLNEYNKENIKDCYERLMKDKLMTRRELESLGEFINDGKFIDKAKEGVGLLKVISNVEGENAIKQCLLDEEGSIDIQKAVNIINERINKKLQELGNLDFDKVLFSDRDGYAVVEKEGKEGLFQKTEDGIEEVLSCKYNLIKLPFDKDGYAVVEKEGKEGLMQKTEDGIEEVLSCKYNLIKLPFDKDGYAVVKKERKEGLIQHTEDGVKEVLSCEYDWILLSFDKDWYVKVEKDGKQGLMQKTEDGIEEVLSYEYSLIRLPFDADGYAVVIKDGKRGLIQKTKDGVKEVLSCEYSLIRLPFDADGYAVVEKEGKEGLFQKTEDGIDEIQEPTVKIRIERDKKGWYKENLFKRKKYIVKFEETE